jgi:hypothetical protein
MRWDPLLVISVIFVTLNWIGNDVSLTLNFICWITSWFSSFLIIKTKLLFCKDRVDTFFSDTTIPFMPVPPPSKKK